MMPLNLKGVFLTFILSTFSLSLQGKEISWTKVKEEHGVKVYKAEVLERIAFCGTGELKGEPERLISIIENPNGWKNWIENFKSGKVIEVIDPNHRTPQIKFVLRCNPSNIPEHLKLLENE